jgi:hypothetical protein
MLSPLWPSSTGRGHSQETCSADPHQCGDRHNERRAQGGGGSGQPPGHHASQRAGEVSNIIRGSEVSGGLRGEGGLCGHQRQDGCVGKAADAHGGRQRGSSSGHVDVRVMPGHPAIVGGSKTPPRHVCSQLEGVTSQSTRDYGVGGTGTAVAGSGAGVS